MRNDRPRRSKLVPKFKRERARSRRVCETWMKGSPEEEEEEEEEEEDTKVPTLSG
jgi:hypothetical protein